MFVNGMGLWLSLGCLALSALVMLIAVKMGWWIKKK
jgi:ESS family glutamate:Na+ symporter